MIKAFFDEIKTSMLCYLDSANNTILSCFFFFFFIIDLNHAILAQIFSPIAELVVYKWIPSKEAKTEIKIHPVIAEAKVGNCWK